MALFWSRKSRSASIEKEKKEQDVTLKLIQQRITKHSTELLKLHPELDFLIYGHYHYPLDTPLAGHARQIVLGDWITHFSYALFDGENLELRFFDR